MNKGSNNEWKMYRIIPVDPTNLEDGIWKFDYKNPIKLSRDCMQATSEKAFYLRDFPGATEAERHKNAIAACIAWRRGQL